MRTLAWLVVPTVLAAMATAAPAAEKDDIQKAVDRGVAYLKSIQQANGSWQHNELGATPLAGLTLLECGVKADDPAVQKAATLVRENCITLTHTYSLSLCIMFLDRLGEPADVPLIESMAVRLLAGQNSVGGWTYNCPNLGDNEVRRLAALVKNRNELVAGRDVPKPGEKREVKDLPKEIQLQLLQIAQGQVNNGGPGVPPGPVPIRPALGMEGAADNSNTQFATLALWVARRHGMPADQALAKVDARFRATQAPDGGWNYSPLVGMVGAPLGPQNPMVASSPAMTCAGLLGLAAGHGVFNDAAMKKDGAKVKDPNEDKVIKAGLIALGSAIGHPAANRLAPPMPGGQLVGPNGGAVPMLNAQQNGKGYYFLWSLERVAVVYGLETIGNKDWYAWGCEILLRNQQADGSWQADYGNGGVDTSFALLFLRRANFAQDLTATLKGRVQDPEKGELKAGGVGGADLKKGLGLKPAFEAGGKDARKTEVKEGPVLEGEAAKLAEEVLAAQGKKQEELLEKLRDGKGVMYTQALTGVIPKMSGQVKGKARELLAERLTRMNAATLKDKLSDDDLEVRRAAALAVALKEDRTLVPRLIEMLTDPEPPVANAALAALQSLTKQNFGPDPEATRAERDKAVSLWKAWWAKQNK